MPLPSPGRIAWDGQPYTRHEFCEFYGDVGNAWWEEAMRETAAGAPQPGVTGTPSQRRSQRRRSQSQRRRSRRSGAALLGAQPGALQPGVTSVTGTPSRQPEEAQPEPTIAGALQPDAVLLHAQPGALQPAAHLPQPCPALLSLDWLSAGWANFNSTISAESEL